MDEFIDTLLTFEELEDTQFQSDILVATATNTPNQPQEVLLQSLGIRKKKWKSNPSVAKEALELVNYRCEIDPFHETFISEVTGDNFVEAHHLIP
ncbi:hypothetical protein [Peribacillus butanolivorans]|uniref:hypothetical protein n=1 Tax=Peribacillus butanolivorans TaxID=421767 RepID=UPI00367317F4